MAVPESLVVRLNVKALLVVLLLAVPPLVVDMFLVLDRSQRELTSRAGDYFEGFAANAASEVARFIRARVVDAKLLAADEQIRKIASQARSRDQRAARLSERFAEIDGDWETPKVEPVTSQLLGNDVSIHLREYLALNSAVSRILVTDSLGAAVAASHKPIRYYHGAQEWWTDSLRGGPDGGTRIGGVAWDPVTLRACLSFSSPIADPKSGSVLGVVRILVDAGELEKLLAGIQLGATGKALLADREGALIGSQQPAAPQAEEMEVVAPLLKDRALGHAVVRLRGGRQAFVGYADLGLSRPYPEVDWVVIVTQDMEEVSAPIQTVNTRALVSGFLAILVVGLVAVYFTTHRPEKLAPMHELLETETEEAEAAEGLEGEQRTV